jgi:transposase InsO family protein
VESFFASWKRERIHDEKRTTREQTKANVFEYIEVFYNRLRLHSSLGYVSPAEFERAHNQDHR